VTQSKNGNAAIAAKAVEQTLKETVKDTVDETSKETTQAAIQAIEWESQARAFIAQHWPGPERLAHPGAFDIASQRWYQALAEQGWSVAHWPRVFGGASWSKRRLYQWHMLCQSAQTPPINTLAMSLIAPLLMAEEASAAPSRPLRDQMLSEIGSFEAHWCLGLLEPVGPQSQQPTRLDAREDGYVLTGSKRAVADGLLMSTQPPQTELWPKRILCLAMDPHDQWRACVLPTDRAGVSIAPVPKQRGRWFQVTFDGVLLGAEDLLPVPVERVLSVLAGLSNQDNSVLPSASSQGLGTQLALLKEELRASNHEDAEALLTQLSEAEVALEGLRALEARALAPLSPQLPEPLPMAMLILKSQELEQQIGTLQMASFGYYALPQSDALIDHNQAPINPAGDSAILVSQALSALAASHYGWDPRDVLARHWLNLEARP
jgi:alkylation response protein AidB-like acyl-CoA dehydrogenase